MDGAPAGVVSQTIRRRAARHSWVVVDTRRADDRLIVTFQRARKRIEVHIATGTRDAAALVGAYYWANTRAGAEPAVVEASDAILALLDSAVLDTE
jgi:hypothetical protein